MDDRRRQQRKDLMSYSQVHNLQNGKLLGYLGELPDLPDINDTSMTISVRVAYCHQDISPNYYNLGLEFSSITDKQMNIIQAVMDNYEFRRESPNYPPHPNELDKG